MLYQYSDYRCLLIQGNTFSTGAYKFTWKIFLRDDNSMKYKEKEDLYALLEEKKEKGERSEEERREEERSEDERSEDEKSKGRLGDENIFVALLHFIFVGVTRSLSIACLKNYELSCCHQYP